MRSRTSCLLIAAATLVAGATGAAIAAPSAPFKAPAPSAVVLRVGGDDGAYEDRRSYRRDRHRGAIVDAPFAHVDAGHPVIVDAPFAHVGVHRGHVRVIAPFVDLWVPR